MPRLANTAYVTPEPIPLSSQLDWTDFYIVLTIAQRGSIAIACKSLQMTHSTLLRKLDLIETRLKTRLFDRVRGNYSLTPAGQAIDGAARLFLPIARDAETRALGRDLQPSGEVRISVASMLIQSVLPPVLAQFASAFPDVQIELSASRAHVSVRRREADVAIRIADSVPDWLIGRKLADIEFRVYGLRRSGDQNANLPLPKLILDRRWIGFERDARELKFDRWLAEKIPEEKIALRVDSFTHALTMVRAGLGVALLPAFLEAYEPELQPLTAPIKELQTPLWLLTHPEIKDTARIRVLLRAFAPAIANSVRTAQERLRIS